MDQTRLVQVQAVRPEKIEKSGPDQAKKVLKISDQSKIWKVRTGPGLIQSDQDQLI